MSNNNPMTCLICSEPANSPDGIHCWKHFKELNELLRQPPKKGAAMTPTNQTAPIGQNRKI